MAAGAAARFKYPSGIAVDSTGTCSLPTPTTRSFARSRRLAMSQPSAAHRGRARPMEWGRPRDSTIRKGSRSMAPASSTSPTAAIARFGRGRPRPRRRLVRPGACPRPPAAARVTLSWSAPTSGDRSPATSSKRARDGPGRPRQLFDRQRRHDLLDQRRRVGHVLRAGSGDQRQRHGRGVG